MDQLLGSGSLEETLPGWTLPDDELLNDEDFDDNEWSVIQAPFLPPPPSEPEEVEHWTRAMFTDAQARRRSSNIQVLQSERLLGLLNKSAG